MKQNCATLLHVLTHLGIQMLFIEKDICKRLYTLSLRGTWSVIDFMLTQGIAMLNLDINFEVLTAVIFKTVVFRALTNFFLTVHISTLKMEAEYFSETLVSVHKTTRCCNTEDHNFSSILSSFRMICYRHLFIC
jgi:hypothetical protein